MKSKINKKVISNVLVIIGIAVILIGVYVCATAFEFKRNCKMYIADVILIDKYSDSALDLRRRVAVIYQADTYNYAASFEYYAFNLPKENKIVVYNNPSRLFSEAKTDWDISKNVVWIMLGLIILGTGGYINVSEKKNKNIDKNNQLKSEK